MNDIENLKSEVQRLNFDLQDLKRSFDDYQNTDINAQQINLFNILGNLQTVTQAPTLTPTTLYDQVQIAIISGTYYLYIFDTSSSSWKRVTIA